MLELAVPVWHSGLTKQESDNIERIQRIAMQIILQERYTNYAQACLTFNAQTLQQRRVKLCSTFAYRNFKSDNCLFTKINSTNMKTRQKSDLVLEYKCNFRSHQKSSLPFLAKLLNENNRNKY